MKQLPIHPSEVLVEDFLKPRGLSDDDLAKLMDVNSNKVKQVTLYRDPINASFAFLLAKALGTSDKFWTNLQAHYDVEIAKYNKENAT